MRRSLLCVYCVVLLLSGCSSDLEIGKFLGKEATVIYDAAKQEFEKGRYSGAIKLFDELERAYPYSKLVPQAQVHRGNCHYKMKKYDDAISEYEIFIRTHPTHEMVEYALYMLGKVHYEQMPIIQRDQENTLKAKEYLLALNSNFPGNRYQESANGMLKVLNRQLAGKNVYVGRYYQRKKNYPASIARFNDVIYNYGDTDLAPEAHHRLVESYTAMGLREEARKVYDAMIEKFPQSGWTQYAGKTLGERRNTASKASDNKEQNSGKQVSKKESPRKESSQKESPRKESSQKESPRKESSQKESPRKESSQKESPRKESSQKESPRKESSQKESPRKESSQKGGSNG